MAQCYPIRNLTFTYLNALQNCYLTSNTKTSRRFAYTVHVSPVERIDQLSHLTYMLLRCTIKTASKCRIDYHCVIITSVTIAFFLEASDNQIISMNASASSGTPIKVRHFRPDSPDLCRVHCCFDSRDCL